MSNRNIVIGSAIATVLAIGTLASTTQTASAAKKDVEKCYGVVKAGKNDCQTATNACAGNSTQDAQRDAWIYVPSGTCLKLVNGSLKAS